MVPGKVVSESENPLQQHAKYLPNPVVISLISGSMSSAITTIVYQPLDLLKTRIQLRAELDRTTDLKDLPTIGRTTRSTLNLVKTKGLLSLWQGTGASLIRSVPGVGLYYATLNLFQSNYSIQSNRPDDATQAFYFGLVARSIVSLVLLPVTVVKVRYESGHFRYSSLLGAIKTAYVSSNGWVGTIPTVLRDSLFSGTYYMLYTHLRLQYGGEPSEGNRFKYHLRLFSLGVMSGLMASLVTNPIDVMKTRIQANALDSKTTMRHVAKELVSSSTGMLRFMDGLGPRMARRTLIAASTWTFYEILTDYRR